MLIALDHPDAADIKIAGGKGAGLSRLAATGVTIPASAIVTTDAWRQFFSASPLRTLVRDLIQASSAEQPAAYDRVRKAVRVTPLSDTLKVAGETYLQGLSSYAAYRSSAVVEDGQHRSFAGLLKSYLGLNPLRSFEIGVKAVWLSLLAPRTLAYLSAFDQSLACTVEAGCAVVVQQLVASQRSGVLFRHPDRIRIEAMYGIGLPLVSGKAAPDVFEWRGETWRQEVQAYKRAALVVAGPGWERLLPGDTVPFRKGDQLADAVLSQVNGGIALVRLPHPIDSEPVLSGDECNRLAAFAHSVSGNLNMAELDLEWSWADDAPIALQARPVTKRLPSGESRPGAGVYSGLGAAPGAAQGQLWSPAAGHTAPDAPFILLVPEIAPEHIQLISVAAGVIARMGGMLSHGAILCREFEKPLVILADCAPFKPGVTVEINGAQGWARLVLN